MKKAVIFFVIAAMLLTMAGCGASSSDNTDKYSIAVTIFPEYDWIHNILGDRADRFDVALLQDSGADLHNFQPGADDIVTISTCDMFVYVGGESDEWAEDALAQAQNKDMIVVKLIDVLGGAVKEEELVEGMEDDHHHHDNDDHDEDHKDEHHDEDHDHEEEHELDEHVWLSLRNASAVCAVLCEKLSAIDPDGASEYEKNAAAYIAKLSELDGEYEAAVKAAARDTILFADRFPFRYLAEDYDLDYYAAFSGCSAETEASFETVIFLAGKVDELGLPAVLTIESCDGKIPQTVIDNTKNKDAKILMMDSMQSVTARDVKDGADYLAIMKENLKALREALE